MHQENFNHPRSTEERWGPSSAINRTVAPKDESSERPLHFSSWHESDEPTMKLEDMGTAKSYDSITNSFCCIAPDTDIKLYKYRFWILSIFSACAIVNGMQWGQYTIMADVNKCFYGVNIYAVDWTSNIFVFIYIPLGLPVSWMINRYGIRISMLVSTFLSSISAGIQCLTLQPDSFPFVMLSQSVSAVTLVFISATPPFLAALWFGPKELSRACSTGVAAHMVAFEYLFRSLWHTFLFLLIGIALGYILAPSVVPHDCSVKSDISIGKRNVAYFLAVTNLILFILVWATFREKPEKPPSISQAYKLQYELNYRKSLTGLCKTKNFVFLLISYGIFCGITTAIGVIFNQIFLPHFPGKYIEIGWISLTDVFAGIIGCVICGVFLDKTHAFKKVYLGLNISVTIFLIVFVTLLKLFRNKSLWIQFISNFILGFVANSHFPVGLEFASEITYPEPELIVTYLMYAAQTIFSITITMIGSWLQETQGTIILFSFFEAFSVLGTIVTVFTKCDNKRNVQNQLTEN